MPAGVDAGRAADADRGFDEAIEALGRLAEDAAALVAHAPIATTRIDARRILRATSNALHERFGARLVCDLAEGLVWDLEHELAKR